MNQLEEIKLNFEQTTHTLYYKETRPGFDPHCVCPLCGDKQWFSNMDWVHEGCTLYRDGYRIKIRCREFECRALFISKDNIKEPGLIQDLKEVEDIKWEKYNETELNLPWYYVKNRDDDFVYDCIGEEVLGNEQYYPICGMNESMMKKLVGIVNDTIETLKEG